MSLKKNRLLNFTLYYHWLYLLLHSSGLQGVLKSIIHSQQDFGGTPTLFGIASVLNHISEMAAYFYSFKIIAKIGHIKVLALGLLCNVIRFIYISFITWPWLILPFEFVQGIPIEKRISLGDIWLSFKTNCWNSRDRLSFFHIIAPKCERTPVIKTKF